METVRMTRLERRAQTRERLLDAAASVFAECGFEAASLDQVAAAAGYTKGAVYSNFASKADLFVALIERRIETQEEAGSEALAGLGPAEAIERIEQLCTEQQSIDRSWLTLAVEFWLHAMRDERSRLAVAGEYERGREAMAGLIETAFGRIGRQPPLPPRDVAIIAEALATGLAFQAAIDPGAVSMRLRGEVLLRLLGLSGDRGAPEVAEEARPTPEAATPAGPH